MDAAHAVSRRDLARRQGRLADMRRYLAIREQEFLLLRSTLLQFAQRYQGELGALHTELDTLDRQVHAAVNYLTGRAAALPPSGNPAARLVLDTLPPAKALPLEPRAAALTAISTSADPPTLKQLYRRAAMRLHPDHASDAPERQQREQTMMAVNEAYGRQDRRRLEDLLREAGALPDGQVAPNEIRFDWLRRAEHVVQERLDLVKGYHLRLAEHPIHRLWQSVTESEKLGQRPLTALAGRLRKQIGERQQELYIGQRLQPGSSLAQAFLSECQARLRVN